MICSKGHTLKSWDELIPQPGNKTPLCKKCMALARKARRALLPARVKAQQAKHDKRYMQKHPDRKRASHDRWIAKNRARWNAYMRAYRASKKAAKLAGPADSWHEDKPIGETTVPGSPGRNQSDARKPRKGALLFDVLIETGALSGQGSSNATAAGTSRGRQ